MKRFVIALSVAAALIYPVAISAQMRAPKPDPELKKLRVLIGRWIYEGEYKPGPLGPGGKITGEYTGQMILGGFFFRGQSIEKGAMGETRFLEIDGYDPVNKNYVSSMFGEDGSTFSGTVTISGNTWTWAGKSTVAGKQYLVKEPFVFAPDFMSATAKTEISVDGHTWTPCFEAKYTKAKPAPKT